MKYASIVMSIAWIACLITTLVGLHITKDPVCLWAMVLPLFISVKSKSDDDDYIDEDIDINE